MLLRISAAADYELSAETFLLLMIEPSLVGARHQVKEELLRTTPTPYAGLSQDIYGNPVRRLIAPSGLFNFGFTATVEASPAVPVPDRAPEHAPRDLPPDTLLYTLPSRYCPSDTLNRLADSEFGKLTSGGERVRAVADWVREHIEYRYGTSDSATSARETLLERAGVCRDFAHLVISLNRALGIPARYVSGYCLGLEPPDFHAWVQVYLGGAWHDVDATFDGVRPALVPIAFGRDAADVSMLTLWGSGICREQSVQVEQVA